MIITSCSVYGAYGQCLSCLHCCDLFSNKFNTRLIVSHNTFHYGLIIRPQECCKLHGYVSKDVKKELQENE